MLAPVKPLRRHRAAQTAVRRGTQQKASDIASQGGLPGLTRGPAECVGALTVAAATADRSPAAVQTLRRNASAILSAEVAGGRKPRTRPARSIR